LGASGTITANTTAALTFSNAGSGDASGTTFNGGTARTISHNSIGAAPQAGNSSIVTVGTITSGTWNGSSISTTYTDAKVTSVNGSTGAITGLATLASPTFSGNASAPTAAADTNTTQLATTAFVVGQASSATPGAVGSAAVGTSLRYARADHTHSGVTSITTSSGLSTNTGATGAVSITNTGVTSIVAGTNISVSGATGAVTVNVSGTVANATYATSAGSATSATTAGTVTTAAQPNITSVGTLSSLTVSGNVTAGNVITSGSGGNVTGANVISGTTLSVTQILNAGSNGVGNIGNSTVYFNTVFAKATSAQYADLAEEYLADATYSPGTVLIFGGNAEVTVANQSNDSRIAGVVSTNPAHVMNAGLSGINVVAVALTGRVPTLVVGTVRKGDMMVSGGNGAARACATPAMGTVIGKALENFDGESGIIEVVVGRL
jgi:hypothetical protein